MVLVDEDAGNGALACDFGEGVLDGGAVVWKKGGMLVLVLGGVGGFLVSCFLGGRRKRKGNGMEMEWDGMEGNGRGDRPISSSSRV